MTTDPENDRDALLIGVKDVARITGLSKSMLDKLRMHNEGPPFFKVGQRCLYSVAGVRQWSGEKLAANMGNAR